jgi:uncharacterized membrane protein
MSQAFKPQIGARELLPHPFRYELNAAPDKVQLPTLCASCGGLAAGKLTFSKVFRLVYRASRTRIRVLHATMPCCDACRAKHLAEAPPMPLGSRLATIIFSEAILVAIFPFGIGLFVGWLAIQDFAAGDRERGSMLASVGGFMVFIGLLVASTAVSSTRRLRVPPLTSVTSAFDFSNNVAEAFDRARYVYALRNERFARAFIAANGEKQWDAESAEAKRAAWKRNVTGKVALAVLALWVIWEIAAAIWPTIPSLLGGG